MQSAETSDYLNNLIFPVILIIPGLLVVLIGLGISFFRYKQHRKSSLLAIVALLINLILLLSSPLQSMLNIWLVKSGTDYSTISYIFGAIGITRSIFVAISLGLLIAAVWVGRDKG